MDGFASGEGGEGRVRGYLVGIVTPHPDFVSPSPLRGRGGIKKRSDYLAIKEY